MKKLLFFIVLVVAAAGFWGCNSDDADFLAIDGLGKDTLIAKPPYIEAKSFSNSWEEYDTVHDLNGEVIYTPWSSKGSVGAFSEDFTDIKREDGWRFVSKLLEGSKVDGRNYFILYNEITGILKVFCYCRTASMSHNNALWYFSFLDISTDAKINKMLNSAGDVALPVNVDVPTSSDYIVSASDAYPNKAITNGWNVAKIPLSYAPNMPQKYRLNIKTAAFSKSYISLFVDYSSQTKGTAVSSYRTSYIPNFKESLVKSSQDATHEWLKSQPGIKNLPKLLADFASASPAGLVADGLNLLGSSFFGLFSQQQSTNYVIELTTNTHGNIEGEITSPEATGITPCNVIMDENKIKTKLGSWTLADYPTLYVHPVAAKISDKPLFNECKYRLVGTGNFKCDVILNPELEKHVISKKVECVPLYFYNVSDSLKPQTYIYPSTEGKIGGRYLSMSEGLRPFKDNPIYEFHDNSLVLLNGLTATADFYGPIDLKTVNDVNKGFWDYIYVPKEINYSHTKIKYNMCEIFAKVTVTLKVKYEDKISTAVMTRTYSPTIEWDPEQVKIYKDMTIESLQGYARYDHIVNRNE